MAQCGLGEDRLFTIEEVTGSTATAMWGEVVVFTIKDDIGLFTDSLHHCSLTVRRECRWDEFMGSIQRQPVVCVDYLFDLVMLISSICEPGTNGPRKSRSMERREDRPLFACGPKRLVQPFEWGTCLWWEGCFLIGLVLAEHDQRAGVEIDVAPTEATSALVVRIAKDLPTEDTRIDEQRSERSTTKLLDRIQPPLVDSGVRSLVEMGEKRFSIGSAPELLTVAPRALVGEFFFGSPCLRWVFSDEFLVDAPAEERRYVVPVGGCGRASEGTLVNVLRYRAYWRMCVTCSWSKLLTESSWLESQVIHSSITRCALR